MLGKHRGVEPADKSSALLATKWSTDQPWTHADERNLRERRENEQVEVALTPGPKGEVAGVRDPPPKPRCPQDHPAWSRQLKVRSSLASELGRSTRSSLHLDTNQACRRENASGRCGRRRRRSNQMISCNGIYKAKVRQGNNHDVTDRMVKGMPAVASKQGPTDLTGKADLSGAMSCGPLVRPWDTKMSGLLPWSSVVVTWKAGCGESRTSGLEWGKDREVLPITTWGAAMLPGYPARLEKEPQGHLAGRLPYHKDSIASIPARRASECVSPGKCTRWRVGLGFGGRRV